MKLNTQSEIRHCTTVVNANRDSLCEVADFIRSERSTGKLIVNFNQGGITSISFEESTRVTQKELDEWDAHRVSGNGHSPSPLSTRGAISVIPR